MKTLQQGIDEVIEGHADGDLVAVSVATMRAIKRKLDAGDARMKAANDIGDVCDAIATGARS